jgi:hypothetical protein
MHANPGRAIVVVTLAADLDHPPRSCTPSLDKPFLQPTVHLHERFVERDPCRTRDRNTPHRLSRLSLGSPSVRPEHHTPLAATRQSELKGHSDSPAAATRQPFCDYLVAQRSFMSG